MMLQFLSFFCLIFSLNAFADPEIDLVPTKLEFSRQLDDDINLRHSQHVSISIQNYGNAGFQQSRTFSIQIGSRSYQAYVYGPTGIRGGRIGGGQTGTLVAYLPDGTLRHCQKVVVDIHNLPQYQLYQNPHRNDRKTLTAMQRGNRIHCLSRPLPRPLPLPRFPIPRPRF